MDTDLSTLNLRATVAMRDEDLRIARKHFVEAAVRVSSPANVAAYERAQVWMDECRTRSEHAHSRLIRHLSSQVAV